MGCKYSHESGEFAESKCGRRQLDESKYCVFHAEDRDVADETVASRFREEIEAGRGNFGGAYLPQIRIGPDVDIACNFLDLHDAYVESLEIINRQLDIPIVGQNSTFEEVTIVGCVGRLTISLRESEIDTLELSGLTTESRINLSGSVIKSAASITDSTFGRLLMGNAVVRGNLELRGINGEQAFLSGADIEGETHMNGATIGEIHCHEVTFAEDFIAPRCHFETASHFQHSIFEGEADFSLSTLNGDVDFRESDFKGVATFSRANLSISNFSDVNVHESIDFRNADFNRQLIASFSSPDSAEVLLDGAKFKRDTTITGGSPSIDISLNHVKSESDLQLLSLKAADVAIVDADIQGKLMMRSVEAGDIDIEQTIVESRIHADDVSCNSLSLSRSEVVHDTVLSVLQVEEVDLAHVSVGSMMAVSESEVDELTAGGGTFSQFHIRDCLVQDLSLNGCEFGSLILELNEVDGFCGVSLVRTDIDRGMIVSPSEEFGFYDFTLSTVGDVEFYVEEGTDALGPVQFVQTTFSGFDFTEYRQSLEQNDWEFDYASIEISEEHTEEIELPDDSASRDPSVFPDVADPLRSKEVTYLKAKNGAKRAGDSRAAAEFFIKEMRHRRARIKDQILEDMPMKNRKVPDKKWILNLRDYLSNLLFDWTSGYGERLRRIGGWTLLTVIGSMIVYWLDGGVRNTTTGLTTSVWNQPVLESGLNSLYFSIVTFTTLGYGDYQPISMVARITAGIESLVGVFIVGIFVYSLGKQISR